MVDKNTSFETTYDWDNLPDPGKLLKPARDNIEIMKVGIREFVSPVDVVRKSGETFRAKGTFSGYAHLEAHLKGVHMSRIGEAISEVTLNHPLETSSLKQIVDNLQGKLESRSVSLKTRFDYPFKQYSLRSINKETGERNFGWMYYPTTIELVNEEDFRTRGYVTVEYLYSSLCPCSTMMSEDYRAKTGHAAGPHSQRSKMITKVEIDLNSDFHIEDLITHHRESITTEVLGSIVKRSDELQFAINNFQQQKFVEDAIRLVHNQLSTDPRILDWVINSSHFESLHDSDATAIGCRGLPGGLR